MSASWEETWGDYDPFDSGPDTPDPSDWAEWGSFASDYEWDRRKAEQAEEGQ